MLDIFFEWGTEMCREMKTLMLGLCLIAVPVTSQAATPDSFNSYILKAVTELNANFAGKGYDIHKAYTHVYDYGTGKIKPTDPP
jgi:hypothetical protein